MNPNLAFIASNLAATAGAHLARNDGAAPAPPRSALARARGRPLREVDGILARALATARRTAPPARRARSGRSTPAGYASPRASSKATSRSTSKSSASDPLAFLRDPRLSIEEKLIKLLGYLNEKWEKEMQKKLEAISAAEAGQKKAASTSGAKKKSGGLFGSLGGIGSAFQSALAPLSAALKVPLVRDVLKQVGGPVLAAGAAAAGFPQLAPVLLKYGPEIVDLASSLTSSPDGGAADGSSGRSAGSSTSGASKGMSDAKRQELLVEIQRLQQKQQEMFGLVSNILKGNHESRQSVINNIR